MTEWETCISTASQHNSTAVAANICRSASWLRLWDMALDYGPRGTAALQALYRTLTRPEIGRDPHVHVCVVCEVELDVSYFEHYSVCHHPFPTQSSSLTVFPRRLQTFLTMHNTFYNHCSLSVAYYNVCYAISGLICINF